MTSSTQTTPPPGDAGTGIAAKPANRSPVGDSIIVEVRSASPQRDWHRSRDRSASGTAIVPTTPSYTERLRGVGGSGAIRRFAQRAARADLNASVTLSRMGKIASSLSALTSQDTVGIGVTSTSHRNHQALTAIGLATVWAKWGHRTLLINADPARNKLAKALGQTRPSLSDLLQALESGKTLGLPQMLTSGLEGLEALSGLGAFSLAQIGETGSLQQLDFVLRTRYDRIVWSLPPLNRDDWSPILIRSVVDSLVLSARRGRTDLRLVRKLAGELNQNDWPPLQVTWHD